MKISDRALSIVPSLTRALFNKAKLYDDCIDLTLGDPDFNTPQQIKEAGINAIINNCTHYSANAGIAGAREATAERIKNIWKVACNPDKNVIITVGGMEAIYLSLLTLVDPGDEVIIFAPYYVNYVQMVIMCGGEPIIIDSYDSNSGIKIDENVLESKITDKTVAIILNSPNNPTGGIIPKESLAVVTELAEKYDLTIISDEVYRTLTYDNIEHQSVLQFENAKERTILIDSLSKEFSMTGWRVGYAFAPENIIENMIKLQENVAACTTVPSQWALIEAYNNNIDVGYMLSEFQKRRDCVCESLASIPLLRFYKPQGTFYFFIDISELGIDSVEFAYRLLDSKHIAVVPGKAYGDNFDNYIRIAFVKDVEILTIAMKKMADFITELSG